MVASTQVWLDELRGCLAHQRGEAEADRLSGRYVDAFPTAFVETHPAPTVPDYLAALEDYARGPATLVLRLVGPTAPSQAGPPRLVLLWPSPAPALLADVFPVLENLGIRVTGHTAYEVRPAGRQAVLVEEFGLLPRDAVTLADPALRDLVTDAFEAVWSGRTEDDGFNQLVIRAGLSWREVALLRAVFAYLRQAGTTSGQPYAQRTLLTYHPVARLLVDLFHARFDPVRGGRGLEQQVLARLEASLAAIDNIGEDRLVRSFMAVLTCTVRTNFYQHDAGGGTKPYLVLKLDPTDLSFLPLPRPRLETFVYSPRVEGLHLRAARVARGGVRWSDRPEDYRTEVLALMKAQRVKNAVIVPQGAKGAFVVRRPPASTHTQALAEEVRHCFATFVRGLLDVTDNLVDGEVVHPPSVVRHDRDDAYLVIAADKGTATFSDAANAIAAEYGFWLGDAFASGGSNGYDHKALGVTARGAWESVRRHLGELGLDPARDEFSVIGIGDMSGDVFGNAMLLSDRIRLVAAFDHRHVFLDPDPDAAASFAERRRLFELPGSSWADYRADLVSAGGGVFSRTAKSISLSPQVRHLLGVRAEQMPADDLIRAVLRAPVDLLFNGGIGTYVKASHETHAQVGDRGNDPVRVDAEELRAKVVAEGGNLGLTQLARIEYAMGGGRINTDFVDNSAGVDTSDREVNLKILLGSAVATGRLAPDQREPALRRAAEQVVEQVLANSAAQAQAISVSQALGVLLLDPQVQVIRYAEERGLLDRAQEFLPDEKALVRRQADGIGLTRPEIAVLLSMSKNTLSRSLLESDVPDDPHVGAAALARYLPPALAEFTDLLDVHPLRREIAVSVLVNELFNMMGSGVLLRVLQLTGQPEPQLVLGYVAARDVLALPALWAEIDRLDVATSAHVQTRMLVDIRAVVEHTTRWFLRHRYLVDPAAEVTLLRPGVDKLSGCLADVLPPSARADVEQQTAALVAAGVPGAVAREVCLLRPLSAALDIVEAAHAAGTDLPWLAEVFFTLGDQLDLDWLRRQAIQRGTNNHWEVLAKTGLRDELSTQQRRLAVAVLDSVGTGPSPQEAVQTWLARNQRLARYRDTIEHLRQAQEVDLAMLSVAVDGLRTLLYSAPQTEQDPAGRSSS